MGIEEIAFYIGLSTAGFLVATEVALYGIGVLRGIYQLKKPNKKIIVGLFIILITIQIRNVAHQQAIFKESPIIISIIGAMVILRILFYRYLMLPPGIHTLNKACWQISYWSKTGYFIPGEKLLKKAKLLEKSRLAKTMEKLLNHSINILIRGVKIKNIQTTIELDKELDEEKSRELATKCLNCLSVDIQTVQTKNKKILGCRACGTITTVKIKATKIQIDMILGQAMYTITDECYHNAAAGYIGLALLYRMMNKFDEAEKALKKSTRIMKQLLFNNAKNSEYLKSIKIISFYDAELNHICGNLDKAKIGYNKSLALAEQQNDIPKIRIINGLLNKIESGDLNKK